MRKLFIALLSMCAAIAVIFVLTPGSGDDDDKGTPKTLEGAKDRIRTLEAEVARLNGSITTIESNAKTEKSELRLLVSQLRQENDDLANTARLGERIGTVVRANDATSFLISIGVNFLSLLVIVAMQLRHRRLLDECNHYITNRLHE